MFCLFVYVYNLDTILATKKTSEIGKKFGIAVSLVLFGCIITGILAFIIIKKWFICKTAKKKKNSPGKKKRLF